MKTQIRTILRCIKVLFCIRPKIVYIGGTDNVNLGDNAQRMLIRQWCKKFYAKHKYIEISIGESACQPFGVSYYFLNAVLSFVLFFILRMTQKKGDIFVTGSGYGLIDHAWSWFAYARLATSCRKTPIVIMPQTINFMNPWIGAIAARAYNSHPRLLLLCRDFVSLEKAEKLFPKCNPIAFPDIVTSLIGTCEYKTKRDGVLFCVRNDGEALYSSEQIHELEKRFKCRVEEKDTTINVKPSELHRNPDKYVFDFIKYVASFKAVITDRYHGTIFSVIANTPVVVLSSTDHKLSSGVKWFPNDFEKYVKYANSLDCAYDIASDYLRIPDGSVKFATYFKDNYWDVLKDKINGTLFER